MKRCSSPSHLIGPFALSWLIALAFSLPSYAQNGANDNDPHATGYLPPTPEQERHLRETHPRIVKVWPNRLAWVRINEERKKKGLEPLPEKGFVPKGAEKAFTVGDGPVISGVPQGFVGLTELSSSADNSVLDAFPEIRSQGSIGSCTNFAVTYYQLTYTVRLAYQYHDARVNPDWEFSPKWTYNMINGGVDGGSWPGDAYHILERHGAATWAQFPYQNSGTDPKSYREWCLNGQTWRDAIKYRIAPFLPLEPPASGAFETWLTSIKTMLADYDVLTFATYISGWQYTTIKNDQSTSDDNAFVGKPVAYWVNPNPANHMMTIVGYNDSIWTDINNNNVVDPGEKGALKIANSWGTGWGDSGFCWLAYDALRDSSDVSGAPSSGRQRAIAGRVYSISVPLDYKPTLLAKFKLTHARRNQLGIALATSSGATWTPGALQFQGGPYAFDGTTTACEGTFVFDFTDLLQDVSETDAFELWVADDDDLDNPNFFGRRDRRPAKLLHYGLIDGESGATNGGPLDPPLQVDAGADYVSLAYPSDTGPVAVASASPTSGRAPLLVTFDAGGSSGANSYKWVFGDGFTGTGPVVTHTYSATATYVATLTAVQTATGAESSDQVTITVTRKK